MASTTFTDQVTPVVASWLNDVNNATYNGIIGAQAISYSDTGIAGTFATTVAGYNQVVIQNKSAATNASANLNISNNAATATTNFIELGINSSTFTGTGSFSQAGNSYVASATTDLVLGTYAAKTIRFVYNSGATDSAFIDATGFNATNIIGTTATITTINTTTINSISLRGYIDGLILSTPGSSTIMTISSGVAMDSTNTNMMRIASTYTKTTSSWVVGTGAGCWAKSGAIIAGYVHWYVIRRPDTGVVDICCTDSATGLVAADYVSGGGNIPVAYTQYRRVASWETSGGFWGLIYHNNNIFTRQTPVLDINSSSFLDSSTLYALSVPLGIKVYAMISAFKVQGNSGMTNFWSPEQGTIGASSTVTPLGKVYTDSATGANVNTFIVLTNTNKQIYGGSTATNQTIKLVTEGWIDNRGRDS